MKKLISLLFVFAFFAAFVNAQTTTVVSRTLREGDTYYGWSGTQTVGGVTADTAYWEIITNKDMPTNCNARVELTRAGSTDTYDIDLQGKIFENSTYAAIIESAANTATKELLDTTRMNLGNCAKYYRYYRVIVNDDNACAATDSIIVSAVLFKLYQR